MQFDFTKESYLTRYLNLVKSVAANLAVLEKHHDGEAALSAWLHGFSQLLNTGSK